jgi:hypothetical protein
MTARFDVIQAFEAKEAICDRVRRFNPGDIVTCDSGQHAPTILVEADMTLFLVDRSTFDSCCKWKNEGGSAI